MPIPEPSDVEKCVHLNFEDQENECKKLECDLQRISKAKDKVVAESEASYLEPFQVNIQLAKVIIVCFCEFSILKYLVKLYDKTRLFTARINCSSNLEKFFSISKTKFFLIQGISY